MKREDYISDALVVKRVNEAVRIELEKKKQWTFQYLYMIERHRAYISRIVMAPR